MSKYTILIKSNADYVDKTHTVEIPIDANNVSEYIPKDIYGVYLAIIQPKPTQEIVEDLERWIDEHSKGTKGIGMNKKEQFEVWISVPAAYNPGECRFSKQVIGPRGGKSWVKIGSTPATGGSWQMFLEPGRYKRTHWSNGMPSKAEFDVTDQGEVEWDE